jgi:hypothetical protein
MPTGNVSGSGFFYSIDLEEKEYQRNRFCKKRRCERLKIGFDSSKIGSLRPYTDPVTPVFFGPV